jgi:hypothetical protein
MIIESSSTTFEKFLFTFFEVMPTLTHRPTPPIIPHPKER